MEYVKVASTSDLPVDGARFKVEVGDKTIMLTRISGSIYAIDNKCTHMGGSLVDGMLDGVVVTCPRHGSQFDVTAGQLLAPGHILGFAVRAHDVPSYPIKVEETDVLLGVNKP